jgi:tetratricopeptide (TPR) repeat protein
MKTLIFLCTLILAGLSARAESPEARFTAASAAYASGDFAEAVAILRKADADGPVSPGLLHNLGNAEWKVGRPGYAILAWERARSLDPHQRNTAANLRFARRDSRLEEPARSWYEQYSEWLSPTIWLSLASGGLWGGIALLTLPRLLGWRRADWHQGITALGLAVFLLTVPALAGLVARSNVGVIIGDDTELRLTPTREAEKLGKLPAGEVARVEKERGDYLYVRAEPDRAGWLRRAEFTRIWAR